MGLKAMVLMVVLTNYIKGFKQHGIIKTIESNNIQYNELDEHTLVTDSNIFPYVVAILKMSKYLSAGALIDENWVLTAADALFLLRESKRRLRVRLGSINYKKGGMVVPIKFFEIHPEFDDNKPLFDLALIRLSYSIRFTPTLKSIRLQKSDKEVDATHFIVTSWPYPMMSSDESEHLKSMEVIKRRRILSVTHLHPSDAEDCAEELAAIGINDTDTMLCLDTGVMMDACMRDVGAPVVLNDVLWGIVSSWRPSNCENDLAGPSFVTLVSSRNVSSWIHATVHGPKLEKKPRSIEEKYLNDFGDSTILL